MARAYAAEPEGTLVISPDNKSRQELNAAIRDQMRETGQLGTDACQVRILINRQEVTGEDRGVATSYRVGDSVRYLRGSEPLGLDAKSYATVIGVDGETNEITVKRNDGKAVTYDPVRLKGVTIYEPELRSFAQGDRVQFTAPWREKAISTRDTGTITYLDGQGNIRVALDGSERTVGWNLNQNKHIDYAYAMTSHSSQGATVDRVFIQVDPSDSRTRALVDQTLAYVATSRPRYDAQVFTDHAEQLGAALNRSHRNVTALAPEQVRSYAVGI
jgi:ATP-dependent exoDNAse (exonuclease V) alpha subunit